MSSQERIREELRAAVEAGEPVTAATSNGQSKTPKVIKDTKLPPPAPGTDVTIQGELADGSRVKYDARAEDIPVTPDPVAYRQAQEFLRTQGRKRTPARYTNLTEWLEFWRDMNDAYKEKIKTGMYAGKYEDVDEFKMVVTRKTDPPLLPDQNSPFNNPCSTNRPLGEWPFPLEINPFIGYLQKLNGTSGGEFRVELRDAEGSLISRSWFDERNQPLEGQENGIWEGQIPNPLNTQKPKEESERRKIPTIKDLITELKEQKANLEELNIIPKDGGNSNNGNALLDSISSQAAASIVTTLKETLTAIHSSAGNTGSTDKGFFREMAGSDEGQKRIWSGFDNVTNLLSMVAGDWIKGRNERLQHKQRMEELKLIKENPELARVYEQQQQAQANASAEKEDIFDYMCRACEEKRTDFTLEDPKVKEMSAADVAMIRGALVKDSSPEEVLELFIQVATFKGKGERAKALKGLPQTIQFIERLQRSVKGA
jgi:hypothetical protein